MHRLMAGVTILEHELSELRLLVERQTGIVLDCPNSALASHVADYVEARGLGSSNTLLERLRSGDQDPTNLPSLLEGVLNVNTGFFRHPGAMDALPPGTIRNYFSKFSSPVIVPEAVEDDFENESENSVGSSRGSLRGSSVGSSGKRGVAVAAIAGSNGHLLVKPRLRSLVTF